MHVLGSFIFGLALRPADTFKATADLALKAVTFAQFVMLTPFPGTVDFERWEKEQEKKPIYVDGIPVTRYWLIPGSIRPKMFMPHALMSTRRDQRADARCLGSLLYLQRIWKRSVCARRRCADGWRFIFLSKLYRQMYAGTGISTDSARSEKANGNGEMDCPILPQALPVKAYAGVADARVGARYASPRL